MNKKDQQDFSNKLESEFYWSLGKVTLMSEESDKIYTSFYKERFPNRERTFTLSVMKGQSIKKDIRSFLKENGMKTKFIDFQNSDNEHDYVFTTIIT